MYNMFVYLLPCYMFRPNYTAKSVCKLNTEWRKKINVNHVYGDCDGDAVMTFHEPSRFLI